MKSVLFLVVHTRRHKILFLYSFTSCILQWHWHIMMLIQPCTTPALCIIKLSVSSLKPLHGISNQLSEWVLPYIIPELLFCIVCLYIREYKMQKKTKEPHTPGHKSNQTKYGVFCSYLYILRYYSDSCRSYHLLKKRKQLFVNKMNIFWRYFFPRVILYIFFLFWLIYCGLGFGVLGLESYIGLLG